MRQKLGCYEFWQYKLCHLWMFPGVIQIDSHFWGPTGRIQNFVTTNIGLTKSNTGEGRKMKAYNNLISIRIIQSTNQKIQLWADSLLLPAEIDLPKKSVKTTYILVKFTANLKKCTSLKAFRYGMCHGSHHIACLWIKISDKSPDINLKM